MQDTFCPKPLDQLHSLKAKYAQSPNKALKILTAQVIVKGKKNGSICLSFWIWIMEELPVTFVLWQHGLSEIVSCDSIHKPHLQKPKGIYDSIDTYIFNDPLSQQNCISCFGREYVTAPWHNLYAVH